MITDPDYPTIRVHSYYYPSGSSFLCKVSLWPETVSTVGAKTIPRRLRPRVATSRDQRATYPLSASLRDLRVNSLSLSVAAEPRWVHSWLKPLWSSRPFVSFVYFVVNPALASVAEFPVPIISVPE